MRWKLKCDGTYKGTSTMLVKAETRDEMFQKVLRGEVEIREEDINKREFFVNSVKIEECEEEQECV